MFFRSRNEKAKTIEQTARADSQGLSGNISDSYVFHERGGSRGGLQSFGNISKRILLGHHDVPSWVNVRHPLGFLLDLAREITLLDRSNTLKRRSTLVAVARSHLS